MAACVIVGLLAVASPAHAQDEEAPPDTDPTGTEVRGQLKTEDEEGNDVFPEGVEFIVSDA